MRTLSVACASALLLAAAAPAFAQAQPESEVVTFGDLDLYSEEGADTLIRRIQMAADRVCGDRPGPRPISETHSVRACQVETTENAISDVGVSTVTARYYGYQPEIIIEGSYDPQELSQQQSVVVTAEK